MRKLLRGVADECLFFTPLCFSSARYSVFFMHGENMTFFYTYEAFEMQEMGKQEQLIKRKKIKIIKDE